MRFRDDVFYFSLLLQRHHRGVEPAFISMFLKCFFHVSGDVQKSLYFNHEECVIQKIKKELIQLWLVFDSSVGICISKSSVVLVLLLIWKLRLLFRTSCVFYVTEMAAVYCMALKASLWSYLVYASVMAGGFGRCLYLQKSICIGGGLHGKQCQGEITPHLFRRKAPGYFSSGAFRSSRCLSDRKQVQGNVLRPGLCLHRPISWAPGGGIEWLVVIVWL